MKRKWIVLAGVALALGVVATVAVADRGEKMWAYQYGLPMLGHHDLTDEQKEQLQALRTQHEDALREKREAMAALREKHREAVNEILTDNQRATLGPYYEMWAHRIPEDILSGEYMESLKSIGDIDIESLKESIGDIHESIEHWGIKSEFAKLDLTDEQKEQLKDLRKAQREEFHKWRQKQRQAMENILTDEQREKLEMLKDEAFYGGQYGFRW